MLEHFVVICPVTQQPCTKGCIPRDYSPLAMLPHMPRRAWRRRALILPLFALAVVGLTWAAFHG